MAAGPPDGAGHGTSSSLSESSSGPSSSSSGHPSSPAPLPPGRDYRGFVAGVFSGIAKLSVGHPFDTIKVRLQTAPPSQFRGPVDCVTQTLRNEGWTALYKGATPPLLGWMVMDSILMGSLTLYRREAHRWIFPHAETLPVAGHALAGTGAGWTVSFLAAPVEHIKARLQVQYSADRRQWLYRGPIDCTRKIYTAHGLPGIYHGLSSTLLFRTFFCVWWGMYDVLSRQLSQRTSLSTPAVNFWAGGLSAQCFWLSSYPFDVVKQRWMTDPLGGGLGDGRRRYFHWKDAAVDIYRRYGAKGFYRGFVPCILRAFPANAAALVTFEGVMRGL